jgi:hypothetical protein
MAMMAAVVQIEERHNVSPWREREFSALHDDTMRFGACAPGGRRVKLSSSRWDGSRFDRSLLIAKLGSSLRIAIERRAAVFDAPRERQVFLAGAGFF